MIQKPNCVKVYKSESKADRTKYIRSLPLFTSTVLSQWVILYPQQNDNDVRVLIKTIRQFDQGMSFNIPQPEFYPINAAYTSGYSVSLEKVLIPL